MIQTLNKGRMPINKSNVEFYLKLKSLYMYKLLSLKTGHFTKIHVTYSRNNETKK